MTEPPVSPLTAVSWDALPVSEPLPGVQSQTVHGERQTVVRYRYAAGSIFPTHTHSQEQITVVLSGAIAFLVDGQRIVLGPGQVILIPGGTPHGAEVVGTEPVESINSLSPRRVDPLSLPGDGSPAVRTGEGQPALDARRLVAPPGRGV
jgi:quercetin dioxygenase-like cupin family protein